MIGLDTNVLVRYITQDDPKQAAAASIAIESAAERGETLLVQPIVLCELVWVLHRAYGFRKADILPVLERVLRTVQFEVADKDTVSAGVDDYRRGRADFADCYVGRANAGAGAERTLTFDRGLAGNPRFVLLQC